MTASEKSDLARFLDLAHAVARGGGYLDGRPEYDFADDPEIGDLSPLPPHDSDTLERIEADVRSCTACRLCEGRKNAVPGEGFARPTVMVIGEGPGQSEDESGRPFVGKAGQLLDKMLAAIGLSRETNCFIANVVKCRPPGNRDPQPDETAACRPFLERQAMLLKPAFVLCAGRVAARNLLDTDEPIGRLRGRVSGIEIAGMTIPFLATYHPSALLRNEDLKRPAWEDLKLLRSSIDKAGLAPSETGKT